MNDRDKNKKTKKQKKTSLDSRFRKIQQKQERKKNFFFAALISVTNRQLVSFDFNQKEEKKNQRISKTQRIKIK